MNVKTPKLYIAITKDDFYKILRLSEITMTDIAKKIGTTDKRLRRQLTDNQIELSDACLIFSELGYNIDIHIIHKPVRNYTESNQNAMIIQGKYNCFPKCFVGRIFFKIITR